MEKVKQVIFIDCRDLPQISSWRQWQRLVATSKCNSNERKCMARHKLKMDERDIVHSQIVVADALKDEDDGGDDDDDDDVGNGGAIKR